MGTATGLYIVGAVASAHRQWGSSGVNITVNVISLNNWNTCFRAPCCNYRIFLSQNPTRIIKAPTLRLHSLLSWTLFAQVAARSNNLPLDYMTNRLGSFIKGLLGDLGLTF